MSSPSPSPSLSPIDGVLRERFGLSSFRPWQKEAIERLLDTGRVLVVAPTGGGKSLTYQLPAAMLEGTTLVLSPLVALMEDQVRGLTARGIEATFIASTLDPDERRHREAMLARGKYKLVYAAPERLASSSFVSLLSRCNLSLVAVDEAHCIAQWGHDFRPDYLRIGELLERLRPPRVLACTATATPEVRREIRKQLHLDGPEAHEVLRGFARPNLHLAAQTVEGPKDALLTGLHALTRALGSERRPKGGAIVYLATRKSTERWTAALRDRGWNAAYYHAGEAPEVRSRVANAFANRSLDVVVATNAFGMGIDCADIRLVLHGQPPGSLEAYYQEVGRAGRDGEDAHGLLLCSGVDIALRRKMSESGSDGAPASREQAARAWGLFREMLRYLDARTCRHDFVLRYFGDEQEVLGGCGHCDVCMAIDAVPLASGATGDGRAPSKSAEETSQIVLKGLSGVARARQRGGLLAIAEMLRGGATERTERFGFTKLSTFGLLSSHPPEWIVALLRSFLAAGWIDLTPSEHPVPFVTPEGWAVLKGQVPIRIALPEPLPTALPRAGSRKRKAAPAPVLGESDAPLLERLRAHRSALAKELGVPAYVVAHDRTLADLAHRRPRSAAELATVHGFGPAKIERYGEGFLAVLERESATPGSDEAR